jgi:hypothetical protein
MATKPSRISSAIVCSSWSNSIKSLPKPFENTSKSFAPASRKVSLHFEHVATPVPKTKLPTRSRWYKMYRTGAKFPSKPHFFDSTADVIDLVSKTKALVQEKIN